MIRLRSAAAQRAVARAVRRAGMPAARNRTPARMGLPEGDGYDAKIALLCDGDNLSSRVVAMEWGQSAIPITLDATIAGYLPRRLEDAKVRLVADVEGHRVNQMVGHKTAVLPGEDPYTSDLLSSSAGSLGTGSDAVKLGAFTEYPGEAPDRIAWDYARALPYNRGQVAIRPVPGVSVDYSGSGAYPGFMAHEPVGELLNRMGQDATVGYRYRDTALNGFVAWVPKPLSLAEADFPEAAKTYSSEFLPDWPSSRPAPSLTRYSAVRVYHQGPDGRDLWQVVEPVPYADEERRPHRRRTHDVPFEDASDAGMENARALAKTLALDLARRPYEGAVLLPAFDPLVELDDRFRVDDSRSDDDGTWHLLWGMRVEGYKHAYGENSSGTSGSSTGALSTVLDYGATLLAEEKLAVPAYLGITITRHPNIVPTPRIPYGVSGDDLYFDDSLAWATTQGDDLIFYDNSNGAASVSGDDLAVSR